MPPMILRELVAAAMISATSATANTITTVRFTLLLRFMSYLIVGISAVASAWSGALFDGRRCVQYRLYCCRT